MTTTRLKPLWLHLSTLSARLRNASHVAVASDYDGTLTPIAEHPSDALLHPRAFDAIRRLRDLPDTALGVFSGRSLDDLVPIIGMQGIFLAGSSGLITVDERGQRRVHVEPADEIPAGLRDALESWCTKFTGAWLEDKAVSFALHYRGVELALHPAFGAGVRRRWREWPNRSVLLHGKRVFELLPAVAKGKSAAIELWLEQRAPATVTFFFGDDVQDEPAHEAVRALGGVTVAVGRKASKAEYFLESPADVVWFLEWLEREWGLRGPQPERLGRPAEGAAIDDSPAPGGGGGAAPAPTPALAREGAEGSGAE